MRLTDVAGNVVREILDLFGSIMVGSKKGKLGMPVDSVVRPGFREGRSCATRNAGGLEFTTHQLGSPK